MSFITVVIAVFLFGEIKEFDADGFLTIDDLLHHHLQLESLNIPRQKRSKSKVVDTKPSFNATQLNPTKGNRLTRTMAFKLLCLAINSEMGGE